MIEAIKNNRFGKGVVLRRGKQVIILLVCALMLTAIATAQDNGTVNRTSQKKIQGQPTLIVLDTKNRTGYLVYKEIYYVKNDTGGLAVDNSRIFYRGYINSSKIQLRIIRPLDKKGMYYDEGMVKAVSTLDNETILNAWYRSKMQNNTSDKVADPVKNKKSPGFESGISTIAVLSLAIISRNIRRSNGEKRPSKGV